jgi:hypothetical protein
VSTRRQPPARGKVITEVHSLTAGAGLRAEISSLERDLRRRKLFDFIIKSNWTVILSFPLIAIAATAATWGQVDMAPMIVSCVVTIPILGGFIIGLKSWNGDMEWNVKEVELEEREELERNIAKKEVELRVIEAEITPSLQLQRRMYREEVAGFIEEYQKDSSKYRKTHNRLQSAIIIGSLSTTTIAALGSSVPAHQWVTVGVSFTVGLSSGFTGYFKFRERSFYLQQTADSIEQESHAMSLGIGDYRGLGEDEALSLFIERVERIRNEQRQRQQQLDQPKETHDARSTNS